MAVVPCGGTPSSDCGTFNASAASVPFWFTTSNGNPLLMHSRETHGVCFGYNAQNDPYGLAATYLASIGAWGNNGRAWTLYPFHIEVRGTADISYNSNGELIVTLNNVVSTLTGTAGDVGREFQAYMYTAGFVSWAVNVKLFDSAGGIWKPSLSDPGWNKCMGGWWSAAPTSSCYDHCPGGGTLFWWNSWNRFGTPYEQHGRTPTRMNNGISFNLGVVRSHTEQLIGIFARAARGACGSSYFSNDDGDMQQCFVISIPPMNICPPEINGLTHERDICEETIDTVVNVTTPTFGVDGVNLVVMYEAINRESDWSDSKARTHVVYNVPENSTFDVRLPDHLIPNTNYFFKIYLEKDGRKSDEIMVCDQWTPYMPAVGCVIPLFTMEECEILAGGDCLDELTAETAEECC